MSLTSPALAGRFFTRSATWEAQSFQSAFYKQTLEDSCNRIAKPMILVPYFRQGRNSPFKLLEMATHSSIHAGKSHGPRSLVGYNPWGRKESDMTERLLCVCTIAKLSLLTRLLQMQFHEKESQKIRLGFPFGLHAH